MDAVEGDHVGRQLGQARLARGDSGGLERPRDEIELFAGSGHDVAGLAEVHDILGARVDRGLEERVEARGLGADLGVGLDLVGQVVGADGDALVAVQAGREVRILVDSSYVNDRQAKKLSRDVAGAIEQTLTYPGEVKVTVLREIRAVEYAK